MDDLLTTTSIDETILRDFHVILKRMLQNYMEITKNCFSILHAPVMSVTVSNLQQSCVIRCERVNKYHIDIDIIYKLKTYIMLLSSNSNMHVNKHAMKI